VKTASITVAQASILPEKVLCFNQAQCTWRFYCRTQWPRQLNDSTEECFENKV